jgi:hypothetical protein
MKNLSTLLAICFALFTFTISVAGEDIPVFQKNTTFANVCAKAKFEGKPVMLLISSKTCPAYRNFTNKVLSDSSILGLYGRNFICYNVDADSKEGKKLAHQYNAMVLPTIIYFSPEKQIIFRSHGTDKPVVAATEATKVIAVMETHRIVKEQALTMRNIASINKQVQKKVAISYAKNDAKAGKNDIDKQVFAYTLNSHDMKIFSKEYTKSMNKYK